jgi:hypothetical protein
MYKASNSLSNSGFIQRLSFEHVPLKRLEHREFLKKYATIATVYDCWSSIGFQLRVLVERSKVSEKRGNNWCKYIYLLEAAGSSETSKLYKILLGCYIPDKWIILNRRRSKTSYIGRFCVWNILYISWPILWDIFSSVHEYLMPG